MAGKVISVGLLRHILLVFYFFVLFSFLFYCRHKVNVTKTQKKQYNDNREMTKGMRHFVAGKAADCGWKSAAVLSDGREAGWIRAGLKKPVQKIWPVFFFLFHL